MQIALQPARVTLAQIRLAEGQLHTQRLQILADVLRKPVVRAGTAEATALGAAVLAAAAGGLHPDLETATLAMTHRGARFEPGQQQDPYDRLFTEVYRDLYPAVRQSMARLAELSRSD